MLNHFKDLSNICGQICLSKGSFCETGLLASQDRKQGYQYGNILTLVIDVGGFN